MKTFNLKNNKGFALLFSILISSILLTIGLSIFNIALKELAISTATRQSIHSFYAADSGLEYALYLDLIVGTDIKNIDFMRTGSQTQKTNIPGNKAVLLVDILDFDGPNFKVQIIKSRPSGATLTTKVATEINSQGYDSTSNDRVERQIQQNY